MRQLQLTNQEALYLRDLIDANSARLRQSPHYEAYGTFHSLVEKLGAIAEAITNEQLAAHLQDHY